MFGKNKKEKESLSQKYGIETQVNENGEKSIVFSSDEKKKKRRKALLISLVIILVFWIYGAGIEQGKTNTSSNTTTQIETTEKQSEGTEQPSEQNDKEQGKESSKSDEGQKKEEFNPNEYEALDYRSVARTPDKYKSKKVQFTGKVIQVIEDGNSSYLRVATNGDYDDVVLVGYPQSIMGETHILEDDTVTVYGICMGTTTYESAMGGQITVPTVLSVHIDL